MAEFNLTPQDVTGKEPALREKFKQKYAENISSGKYDQRDVDRLDREDAYARCFLRTLKAKGDPEKATDVVHEAFAYRKQVNIWELEDKTFPDEIWQKNGIYYKGEDKQGHPILYIDVKQNTATSDQIAGLKTFISYHFEKHQRAQPEQMCVVLLDMSGAGLSNVNLDVTKHIIACFTNYFPSFLAYMLNYELPFILNATWKIISAFLSQEQKQKVRMIKKKDITTYIDEKHLWAHMK